MASSFDSQHAVDVVDQLSPEAFFTRYLTPRIPVIATAAAAAWPARDKWTFAWLAATYGKEDVAVVDRCGERHEMKLAEYVDYLQAPSRYEVPDGPLYLPDLGLHHVPELFDDYARPEYVDDWFAELPAPVRPPFRWFFLGPSGTGSRLHIDTSGTHAWLTQIHGEKEWRLFPPDDIPIAYCGVADAFSPDPERFPAFATARCHAAILRPGETMFVPYGWRHQVRNLGASWAVTENFCNASNLDDVYQHTVDPALCPLLDEVCRHKAQQLRGAPGTVAAGQRDLLRGHLVKREQELAGRLETLRRVIQHLV
jgi:histone arginine demethylase JMJD6